MILDNYVIRIYRRDKTDPHVMVGIVEEIHSRKKMGFNTFAELREILLIPKGRFERHKQRKERRRHALDGS